MVSLEEAWRPHTPSFRVERMWAANRIAIAGLIHVKTSPGRARSCPSRDHLLITLSLGCRDSERVVFCDPGANQGSTMAKRKKQSAKVQTRKLFKDNPPLRLSENLPASWYNICYVPTGMGEVDWHNPPQRLLVLWLTGDVEFETSDGDIRRLPAGSVVLAEDTTGKGHISRHPPEGQLVVHVALA